MIPYGRQDISEADIQAVVDVLKSDFLTQGPAVPAFEKAVADYCDVQFSFAVNSATSALHIACLALGVGKGDLVWTSPITFVASANCARYCGADVDFVDIDSATYNMSVSVLEEKLINAEKVGRLPKVVIPVHLAGQSCEMDKIHALGQKYGFRIIEDASHAIGGKYKGKAIGGCQYSDIAVFSFHFAIAKRYNEMLNEDWIEIPWQHPDSYSSFHLYIIRIKRKDKHVSHLQLFERLRNNGVLANLHYIPVYRHTYYQNFGYNTSDFPEAEDYYAEAISLPMFVTLSEDQQAEVVEKIVKPIGYQNLF